MADAAPPPYMSSGIFIGTISTLSGSTVPSGPLDRRVLDGLSGADYGSLISGMRFLGLADNDRHATPRLRELVDSYRNSQGGEGFKVALAELMFDKYGPIIGKIDLDSGTITQLEKAFRDVGVPQGQMLTKTIRFYVKTLQECGIILSPHILKMRRATSTPRANGARKPKTKSSQASTEDVGSKSKQDTPPDGLERMPIPGIIGAYIQYPSTLTEANCDIFDAMVGALRAYAKGRTGKEKK